MRLEPNDVQPISFDLVLSGVTPPFFEERNLVRNRRTNRVDVNVIRYHQGGWATGTINVDGETHELTERGGVRVPGPLLGRTPGRRRGPDRPDRRDAPPSSAARPAPGAS